MQFGALIRWCCNVITAWKGFGIGCVGALERLEAGGCSANGVGMTVVATAAVYVNFHCVDHSGASGGDLGWNRLRDGDAMRVRG